MTQTDLNVANGTGAAVRADLNNHLEALVTLSAGATAPTTTFAHMWWADTTDNILKRRNAANTAWVSVMSLTADNLAETDADQAWDADTYQRLDGTHDAGSLNALGSDRYTVELGKVVELDADVDGTIVAPTAGYGFAVTHIYNNGARSLTLSGFPSSALNGGTLSGATGTIDILITERASVNGSNRINHWIYNRS